MTAHDTRCACELCFARQTPHSYEASGVPTDPPPSEQGVPQTLDVGRCLTKPEKGEVERLLADWRAGKKIPEHVTHNPLPVDAPEKVRVVAELFLVVVGLRHSELIYAPVMFSERWVAKQPEAGGMSHATAGRAIQMLRDACGFFRVADTLPAKAEEERPVFLYELCPVPAVPVEGAARVVREPDEPEMELSDEPLVLDADVAGHGALEPSSMEYPFSRSARTEGSSR